MSSEVQSRANSGGLNMHDSNLLKLRISPALNVWAHRIWNSFKKMKSLSFQKSTVLTRSFWRVVLRQNLRVKTARQKTRQNPHTKICVWKRGVKTVHQNMGHNDAPWMIECMWIIWDQILTWMVHNFWGSVGQVLGFDPIHFFNQILSAKYLQPHKFQPNFIK